MFKGGEAGASCSTGWQEQLSNAGVGRERPWLQVLPPAGVWDIQSDIPILIFNNVPFALDSEKGQTDLLLAFFNQDVLVAPLQPFYTELKALLGKQ